MNCHIEQRGYHDPILVVDISAGFDCSHWGLTDLYPECEKNLRDLLRTTADFETEWCSSKKELLSARYRREKGKVFVDVNQWIDDLWDSGDLIYDALYDVCNIRGGIELSDEALSAIRDDALWLDVDDSVVISEELGKDATYEDCMKAVERLMDATDKELTAMYEQLKEIVRDYVTHEGLDKKGDAE